MKSVILDLPADFEPANGPIHIGGPYLLLPLDKIYPPDQPSIRWMSPRVTEKSITEPEERAPKQIPAISGDSPEKRRLITEHNRLVRKCNQAQREFAVADRLCRTLAKTGGSRDLPAAVVRREERKVQRKEAGAELKTVASALEEQS